MEDEKELRGIFTVKWLFFSRTFLIGEPGEKKCLSEEPDEAGKETKVGKEPKVETEFKMETELKVEDEFKMENEFPQGKKGPEQSRSRENALPEAEHKTRVEEVRGPGEETAEEKTAILEGKERIEAKAETQVKKKKGIFERIKGKKRADEKGNVEAEKGMTARDKLHLGLEAYKALRIPLFRLFSDLLNAIKIKNLKAELTFGLSDPADTGMLCGFIHALLGTVYSRCRNCSFSVNPVFMESLLDFQGSAEIRVKIYSLIFSLLNFIFNGKTLSFTYSILKEKLRGSSKINS
ncbi:MAG: DUF2953 domain-containing protein [Euryarchaeota archaeon]|nr:DUF2953 domain-containing protein [Euryarchaeota archaeon]